MQDKQRVIMGIDPGTNVLGFGVILVDKSKVHLVDMGVINLKGEKDHFTKLRRIFLETGELMDKYAPDDIAVEAPFYGKNPQVMLKLGRAQGAAIAAALSKDIPIFEYAPRRVKLKITGKGAASKEQVAMMIMSMLKIDIHPEFFDATDALAIAMCHYLEGSAPALTCKGNSSWESFVKNNPSRVKK